MTSRLTDPKTILTKLEGELIFTTLPILLDITLCRHSWIDDTGQEAPLRTNRKYSLLSYGLVYPLDGQKEVANSIIHYLQCLDRMR